MRLGLLVSVVIALVISGGVIPLALRVGPTADEKGEGAAKGSPGDGDGYKSLFNGKDLTGWTVKHCSPDMWTVVNGELVGKSLGPGGRRETGFLFTDDEFYDFDLELQFKFESRTSELANSGLAIRAPVDSDTARYAEVQLIDESRDVSKSLRETQRTGALWDVAPDHRAELERSGSWNTIRVRMVADDLHVWVNGKETLDRNTCSLSSKGAVPPDRSGRIGLQNFRGTVRFRKIRIKALAGERGVARGSAAPSSETSVRITDEGLLQAAALLNLKEVYMDLKQDGRTKLLSDKQVQRQLGKAEDSLRREGVQVLDSEVAFDTMRAKKVSIPLLLIQVTVVRDRSLHSHAVKCLLVEHAVSALPPRRHMLVSTYGTMALGFSHQSTATADLIDQVDGAINLFISHLGQAREIPPSPFAEQNRRLQPVPVSLSDEIIQALLAWEQGSNLEGLKELCVATSCSEPALRWIRRERVEESLTASLRRCGVRTSTRSAGWTRFKETQVIPRSITAEVGTVENQQGIYGVKVNVTLHEPVLTARHNGFAFLAPTLVISSHGASSWRTFGADLRTQVQNGIQTMEKMLREANRQ